MDVTLNVLASGWHRRCQFRLAVCIQRRHVHVIRYRLGGEIGHVFADIAVLANFLDKFVVLQFRGALGVLLRAIQIDILLWNALILTRRISHVVGDFDVCVALGSFALLTIRNLIRVQKIRRFWLFGNSIGVDDYKNEIFLNT